MMLTATVETAEEIGTENGSGGEAADGSAT